MAETSTGSRARAVVGQTRTGGAPSLARTFSLASRPGSAHTLYLDFDGGTIVGTTWNDSYNGGRELTYTPFDIDSSPGSFNGSERSAIQLIWESVAADYAPFDVNVTTATPEPGAIDRDSASDPVFGGVIAVANGTPMERSCDCGGQASLNGVSNPDPAASRYAGPVFVFPRQLSNEPSFIAEAASHEAGHSVGLIHDGDASSDYHSGAGIWAPIMGQSYQRPLSQWSKGEYTGAKNSQDDIAEIAATFGAVPDPEPATVAGATVIGDTDDPEPLFATGTIGVAVGGKADVDAFAFTGHGRVYIDVEPLSTHSDLDIRVEVWNETTGQRIAVIDPAPGISSGGILKGLGAEASVSLTDEAEGHQGDPSAASSNDPTFSVRVSGTGFGDPKQPGGYSSYGSIGDYQVTVTPDGDHTPVEQLTVTAPTATVIPSVQSSAQSSAQGAAAIDPFLPAVANGGVTPYSYSANQLPPGLSIDPRSGYISGSLASNAAFDAPVSITVIDAIGQQRSVTSRLLTGAQPVSGAALSLASEPIPTATVGRTFGLPLLQATGGHPGYTYAATGLPTGLRIDTYSGILTGTAAAVGAGTATFTVTDTEGHSASTSAAWRTLTPVAITERPTPPAEQDATFYLMLTASGGVVNDRTWSTSDLPDGLRFEPRGVITGTPSTPGSYLIDIFISSGSGPSLSYDHRRIEITIAKRLTAPAAVRFTGAHGKRSTFSYAVSGGSSRGFAVCSDAPKSVECFFNTKRRVVTLLVKPSAPLRSSFTVRTQDDLGVSVSTRVTLNLRR